MPDDIDLLDAPAGGGADGKAPTDSGGADKGGGKGGSEREPSADAAGKSQTDASDDGKGASDDGDAAPKGRKARESKGAKKAGDPKGEKGDPGKAPAKAAASDDELGFDDEDENGNPKSPANWPDDWREKIAGGDEKFLKELQRFTSFDAYAKSTRALRQKLSSGEYRKSLPDDASDAEKAEWRKENDIPDKAEDYGLPTIKGHEWSDDDKSIAGAFLADLHAANTPRSVAQAALGWYAKFQQQSVQARADQDRADIEAREDALRTEWGPKDFRPHIKLAKDTFQDDEFMPGELRQALAGARTADGRRLLYLPEFTRFLAERGLERRGPAGLISGEQGARMGGRIDEIKKILATDRERYYAEGLDKELAELQEKMESGRAR